MKWVKNKTHERNVTIWYRYTIHDAQRTTYTIFYIRIVTVVQLVHTSILIKPWYQWESERHYWSWFMIGNKDNGAILFEWAWKHTIQFRLKIITNFFSFGNNLCFTFHNAVCCLLFTIRNDSIIISFFENWMHRNIKSLFGEIVFILFLIFFQFFCTKFRESLSIITVILCVPSIWHIAASKRTIQRAFICWMKTTKYTRKIPKD